MVTIDFATFIFVTIKIFSLNSASGGRLAQLETIGNPKTSKKRARYIIL